jgi:cell division protease FtsH
MVGRWGMSPLGPLSLLPADGASPLLPGVAETSEATRRRVDEEVRRIVESAQAEVREVLLGHRANLDSLALALLERETLDEVDAYTAAGLPRSLRAPETTPPAIRG